MWERLELTMAPLNTMDKATNQGTLFASGSWWRKNEKWMISHSAQKEVELCGYFDK